MDEVPDEYLAEILPLAKKIAKALGVVDYNILQVVAQPPYTEPPFTSCMADLNTSHRRTTGR